MAHPQISRLSTEYLRIPVTATEAGAPVDPTGNAVALALPARGELPVDNDWVDGAWETAGSLHLAMVLIGPDSSRQLTAGFYDVWVRVTASPERPVLKAGTIEIT